MPKPKLSGADHESFARAHISTCASFNPTKTPFVPWYVPTVIPLPDNFVGFDPASTLPAEGFTAYERHLPHWRLPGACYFTTFRLRDSIPQAMIKEMKREQEQWHKRLAQAAAGTDGRLSLDEAAAWLEFQRTRLRKLEATLDEGHGECILRDPAYRHVVTNALHHFEGQRC